MMGGEFDDLESPTMGETQSELKPVIGMIGLGNLGKPMSLSLLSSGYELVVNSLQGSEADDLVMRGAVWAESPSQVAAQVDVLITVLPGPQQVREVMIGKGGALAAMKTGSTFIDMSTSSSVVADEIIAAAEPSGVAVIDAPFRFWLKRRLVNREHRLRYRFLWAGGMNFMKSICRCFAHSAECPTRFTMPAPTARDTASKCC